MASTMRAMRRSRAAARRGCRRRAPRRETAPDDAGTRRARRCRAPPPCRRGRRRSPRPAPRRVRSLAAEQALLQSSRTRCAVRPVCTESGATPQATSMSFTARSNATGSKAPTCGMPRLPLPCGAVTVVIAGVGHCSVALRNSSVRVHESLSAALSYSAAGRTAPRSCRPRVGEGVLHPG